LKLLQVSLRLDRADVERAEALLDLAGALALTFVDAEDAPLFEPAPGTTPMWEHPGIHALFPVATDGAALGAILSQALPSAHGIETRQIDEQDWRAGMEQAVFVRRIAANLGVVPADWDGTPPAEKCVRLHMGLAFGTGQHATTALCLQWLARNPPKALEVCDLGCGSGVLGIAAVMLGATSATAIDTDPQAVAATLQNAKLNEVDAAVRAGLPEEFANIEVDLVIANILADTLTRSVDTIGDMLRPRGGIVLSGVLTAQVADVTRAFSERFESIESEVLDGWACLSAVLR